MSAEYPFYRIIKGSSIEDLEEKINKNIPDNNCGIAYAPHGDVGIITTKLHDGFFTHRYIQAFVRIGNAPI